MPRSKGAAARVAGAVAGGLHRVPGGSLVHSTLTQPGGAARPETTLQTSSSDGVPLPDVATLPSESVENSRRPSGELPLSWEPAHHRTA